MRHSTAPPCGDAFLIWQALEPLAAAVLSLRGAQDAAAAREPSNAPAAERSAGVKQAGPGATHADQDGVAPAVREGAVGATAAPVGEGEEVRGRAAEWRRRYHELLASLRQPPA